MNPRQQQPSRSGLAESGPRKRFTEAAARPRWPVWLLCATGLLASTPASAQGAEAWTFDLFYENDSRYRGEDQTGETVGLSKFRNTLQAEFGGPLAGSWKAVGVLRGTYDGVYDLNADQFGDEAGGAILSQTTTPGGRVDVPFGEGADYDDIASLGLVNNQFSFNSSDPGAPGYNPNEGLRALGDRWHDIDGGVSLGVPVRPCDVDSRGCEDFGGYGDLDSEQLAFPEFNERLDFLREAYVRNTYALPNGDDLFLKLGRQQVIWGRTDLFRVLDVINPVDYSRNNIYDELEDIRIPMWIAQAEWRMGASRLLQDANLQLVWNVDQFRPNNLGQCGSPNVIQDVGCLLRALTNQWDNGGTVANFANVDVDTFLATDFGPGQIGLRDVDLPDWTLSNTQIGAKFEGVTPGGLSFSLNALNFRSQFPSLRGGKGATNPFTGETAEAWPYLIAFDLVYPRVNLFGGSADFEWQAAKAAIRVEAAYTRGEEFPNTLRPELYSENDVLRTVIGVDRPTFIPFISRTRTALISGQLFYQHIFDHEEEKAALGRAGIPDWEHGVIGTLLMKAFLLNDRLSPQITQAYDFRAKAYVVAPSLEWTLDDHLRITVGANVKTTGDREPWKFDDCRACNPFPPYSSGPNYPGDPFQTFSRGLGGFEPLGRFRAGPIGSAWREDEAFVTVRYSF